MTKNVVLKSNGHGISLKIRKDCGFETIISELKEKITEAKSFFKDAHIVLEIQGRNLTDYEVDAIVNCIEEHSKMSILCVVPHQKELEEKFFEITDEIRKQYLHLAKIDFENNSKIPKENQLFQGTLRSGQDFFSGGNAIVIGDINPGATVTAGENVFVFGSLLGNVFAGNNGNDHAYVLALDMNPGQMCINGVYGRSPDEQVFRKKSKIKMQVQIAKLQNNSITIENYKDDGGK